MTAPAHEFDYFAPRLVPDVPDDTEPDWTPDPDDGVIVVHVDNVPAIPDVDVAGIWRTRAYRDVTDRARLVGDTRRLDAFVVGMLVAAVDRAGSDEAVVGAVEGITNALRDLHPDRGAW